jgi:hypothetical protein
MIFVWLLVCNAVLTDYSLPFQVTTAVYAAQLIGWFGLAAYGLWKGSRPIFPLLLWCWVFFISQPMELPTAVELTRLLGFIGLYGLNFEADKLRRWADWLLLPALALPWISRANPNDLSMLIWVTLMVSNRRGRWAVIAAAVMVLLHSEAALIALLTGLAVERWGYKVLLSAIPAMAMIGLWRGPGSSAGERIRYWQYALEHFTVWGNGLPFHFQNTGYAHSLPVDVLYLAGLPGLVLLVVAGWFLWRNRAEFGPWSGFIAGFCVYSLVDYPHWSVPGTVMMIVLSKYGKDQKNYGQLVGHWLRVRFLEFGGFGVGRSHRKRVAEISDSHRTQ